MKRREFITLLGGAAAAWPLAARAQRGERMRRVGALMNLPADDQQAQLNMAAFQQGLQAPGWTIGRNLRLDHRWGPLDDEGLRQRADELVALTPDVMLVAGGGAGRAVQRASRTVPVVLAQSIDPVGAGFVASLARPVGWANSLGVTLPKAYRPSPSRRPRQRRAAKFSTSLKAKGQPRAEILPFGLGTLWMLAPKRYCLPSVAYRARSGIGV